MKLRKISKKGNILTENLVFIMLNLIFLIILILFLFSKIESTALLEEKYAKQIALIIDSADPGMIIEFKMDEAFDKMDKGINFEDIVWTEDNKVHVKLSDKGDYVYSFFNDNEVSINPVVDEKMYIIAIDRGVENV